MKRSRISSSDEKPVKKYSDDNVEEAETKQQLQQDVKHDLGLLIHLSQSSWSSYFSNFNIPEYSHQQQMVTPISNSSPFKTCGFDMSNLVKTYATPVSEKPSHTLPATDYSFSLDIEPEVPDVFELRKGPLLRNIRPLRLIPPSSSLLHLLYKEELYLPDQNYLQLRQNGHLKASRRLELIQWMRSVCSDFTFHSETLYIAVNYFDRYLSKVKVSMRKQFNLVALSCIYLAAKIFEEIKEPCSSDMIESSIDNITIKDLKRMEKKIITALNFDFNLVTPHIIINEVFLNLGTPAVHDSARVLSDLSSKDGIPNPAFRRDILNKSQEYFDYLIDHYSCIGFKPSLIAYSVWIHLQKIGLVSTILVSEKQLSRLLENPSTVMKDSENMSIILDICAQIQRIL